MWPGINKEAELPAHFLCQERDLPSARKWSVVKKRTLAVSSGRWEGMETRGENHTDVWMSLTGCYALPEAQGHGERFVLLPSPGPVACSCLGFYFSSFQAWLHVPSSKRRC